MFKMSRKRRLIRIRRAGVEGAHEAAGAADRGLEIRRASFVDQRFDCGARAGQDLALGERLFDSALNASLFIAIGDIHKLVTDRHGI